ncbi:MAG: hypothetical protein AB1447_10980 [Bacillota bacterium]
MPEMRVVAGCPFGCDPDDVTTMCASCRERFAAGEELPRRRKMRERVFVEGNLTWKVSRNFGQKTP